MVITETLKMLMNSAWRGDKSQSDVLAVLADYKDAGNMTEERNTQVCNSKYCMFVLISNILGPYVPIAGDCAVFGLTATDQ